MALYRRLAVSQGEQGNQLRDPADPSLMNWDYLSYAAGMGLTPTVPGQKQFKSKSSGRKRLSDLPWDISQSSQQLQQQTVSHPEIMQPAQSSMIGMKDSDSMADQTTQNLQCESSNESSQNIEGETNTERKSEKQSTVVMHQELEEKEEQEKEHTESLDIPPTSQTVDQSPPKAILETEGLESDSFTKIQHLTISVKEEPPDVDLPDTVHTDKLSDDDPVEDFSHQDDSGSTTDEYEAEAYFQKLEDSSTTEKDKSDADWTPDEPKKSLKVVIKTPKRAPKRKAPRKGGEKEGPKKKVRKKKAEDATLPTTVCTDADTLYVIPPEKDGSHDNKKKRAGK